MSALVFLMFILLRYSNACLEGKYCCYEASEIIDCSCTEIYIQCHNSKSTLVNYTSILLRGNNLRHLNLTSLFKVFPRVVLLDLRDNNRLLCDDVKRFQPSKLITIISDCTYSMKKIPTNKTTEIPATFSTKPPTHHQNHLTYTFSTGKKSNTVYFKSQTDHENRS